MRRPLRACRRALTLTAAVVLLTACGGSDGDAAASGSGAASSSAAESGAGETGSGFCGQAAGALQHVEPAFADEEDPAALAPALHQAADDVRAIEAPPEIRSEWSALADGMEEFAQAFAEVDTADPASASAFRQRTTEIVGRLSTTATTVQAYLADECGLQVDPTDPAAPTS